MDNKDKIDIVVLFVDMNDKEWRNQYEEYIKTHEIPIPEINNVEVRSRDYGTLKCLLRSIDKNMGWVNNVFLVVQSESQVPDWINKDKVRIVLHEDFIPKEFLPIYNTFTIQTHLHRIKGLSETFIQTDDDSIILRPISPNYFFIPTINGYKCVHTIQKMDRSNVFGSSSKFSHYFKSGASEIGKKLLNIKDDFYYQDSHSMIPMLKSINEEVYGNLDIKTHVSHFREKNNTYRMTFFTYAWFKRKIINVNVDNAYIDFKNKDINQFRKWLNSNQFKSQISVNDQDLNPGFDKELYYQMIEETLSLLFPNKSKYEI